MSLNGFYIERYQATPGHQPAGRDAQERIRKLDKKHDPKRDDPDVPTHDEALAADENPSTTEARSRALIPRADGGGVGDMVDNVVRAARHNPLIAGVLFVGALWIVIRVKAA